MDGQTDGWTDGQMAGWTERGTDRWTDTDDGPIYIIYKWGG